MLGLFRKSHDAWLKGAEGNGIIVPSSGGDYPRRSESVGQCGVSLEYIRLFLEHSSRVLSEESKTTDFFNDVVLSLTKKKHRYRAGQYLFHVLLVIMQAFSCLGHTGTAVHACMNGSKRAHSLT